MKNPRGSWLLKRMEEREKARNAAKNKRKQSVSIEEAITREVGKNGPVLGKNATLEQFHKVFKSQIQSRELKFQKEEPPAPKVFKRSVSLEDYRCKSVLREVTSIPAPLSPIPEGPHDILEIQLADEDYSIVF